MSDTTSLIDSAKHGADLKVKGTHLAESGSTTRTMGGVALSAVAYFGIHAFLMSNPLSVSFVVGEVGGAILGALWLDKGGKQMKHGASLIKEGDEILTSAKEKAEKIDSEDSKKNQYSSSMSNSIMMFPPVNKTLAPETKTFEIKMTSP